MATLLSPTLSTTDPDPELLDLTRLLKRLQRALFEANAQEELRLRNSTFERLKLHDNIAYARNLLIQLEKDTLGLTVQSRRQDAQLELLKKHDLLKRLAEKLQEWDEQDKVPDEEYSSEEEDILGEDTPPDSTEDEPSSPDALTPQDTSPTTSSIPNKPSPKPLSPRISDHDKLFPSTLRARHTQQNISQPTTDTATSTSTFKPTTTLTESLLTENRTEQEALTTSLLSIAQKLRESTLTFSSSLESEKDILERATSGLEKNVTGMESAQARMGFLRKMTEGKGLWGRMMLYAWIFGLMVVAVLIVAVLPKLRF